MHKKESYFGPVEKEDIIAGILSVIFVFGSFGLLTYYVGYIGLVFWFMLMFAICAAGG